MADLTTLNDVKAWLSINNANDDALLTRLISAASDYIQTWLNRTIAITAYNEVRDGTGGTKMMFADYPVTTVTSVKVNGLPVPQSTAFGVPGWVVASDGTTLALRGGVYCFDRDVQNVELSYSAGYAAVPNEIAQSCIELVSLRYKNRDRIGVTAKTLAGEVVSFTQKDFTDAIANTLINYKKVITL